MRNGDSSAGSSSTYKTRRLAINEHGQKEIVIDCRFGRVPAPGAIVDTGAQRSVMSGRFYDLHRGNFPAVNRRSTVGIAIEGIAGDYYRPRGEIVIPITFCDAPTKTNYHVPGHSFLVVDGLCADVLLGMDLMQEGCGITTLEVTTGQVKYSPLLTTSPYSPPQGNAARYPVRLLKELILQPGQALPIALRIGDDDEDERAHVGGSLLINPTVLTGITRGAHFSLGIPEHLRTLEDRTHRVFHITASNPTKFPVRIRAGVAVAEGELVDERSIRPVSNTSSTSGAVSADPLPETSRSYRRAHQFEARQHRLKPRRPSDRERRAWMQHGIDEIVRTLLTRIQDPSVESQAMDYEEVQQDGVSPDTSPKAFADAGQH